MKGSRDTCEYNVIGRLNLHLHTFKFILSHKTIDIKHYNIIIVIQTQLFKYKMCYNYAYFLQYKHVLPYVLELHLL